MVFLGPVLSRIGASGVPKIIVLKDMLALHDVFTLHWCLGSVHFSAKCLPPDYSIVGALLYASPGKAILGLEGQRKMQYFVG